MRAGQAPYGGGCHPFVGADVLGGPFCGRISSSRWVAYPPIFYRICVFHCINGTGMV